MNPEKSKTAGITLDNPYVGPSEFEAKHKDIFFGRDPEAKELISRLLARRLVLFYAESGAGKSSLINARLIPSLKDPKRGFEVLPKCRVISGEAPAGLEVDNIFIFNLMLELDQSDVEPERFAKMQLSDFLLGLAKVAGKYYYVDDVMDASSDDTGDSDDQEDVHLEEVPPRVLIIDQFEEIFTTHLWAWDQREPFFRQLNQAMEDDPFLYVVLVIREDYVARLDPYVHLLPGELRTRDNMQRMRAQAAIQAVRKPAEMAGRPFAEGVAEDLVDNLRLLRTVDQEGKTSLVSGEYIEPVQLQVVCYQLWEDLKDTGGDKITGEDVKRLARNALAGRDRYDDRRLEDDELLSVFIDTALAGFYERALAKVMLTSETEIDEPYLRDWFSNKLITEDGTRGFLNRGKEETAGVKEPTVALIEKEHLIRTDTRAGAEWIELVHDRFVEPIREANQNWTKRRIRQTPWVGAAHRWGKADRDPALLLQDAILDAALKEAGDLHRQPRIVRTFLEASISMQASREQKHAEQRAEDARKREQRAQQRAEKETAINNRLRWQRIGLVVVSAIAVVALIVAVIFWRQAVDDTIIAEEQTEIAEEQTEIAEEQTEIAEEQKKIAEEQKKIAEAATALAKALRLASLSQDHLEVNNTAGALLAAVEAAREMPTTRQTQSALLASLDKASYLGGVDFSPPSDPIRSFTGQIPSPLTNAEDIFPGPEIATLATLHEGKIHWWSIAESEPISQEFPLTETNIELAVFSPDRSLLATANDSVQISLWTVKEGDAVQKWSSGYPTGLKQVTALAFSPDGSKLAVSGCSVLVPTEGASQDVDASPGILADQSEVDSRTVDAVESTEPTNTCEVSGILVWELDRSTEELKKVEPPEINDSRILDLTFSEDGSMLIWMDQQGEIEFRALRTDEPPGFLPKPEGGRYTSMVVLPGGQLLVGGCTFQEEEDRKEQCGVGFVQWWSLAHRSPIGTAHIWNPEVLDVVFAPNRSLLVALDGAGLITWFAADASTWLELACLSAGRNMTFEEWKEAFPNQVEGDYQNTCEQYLRDISFAAAKIKEADQLLRRCQNFSTRRAQSLFEDAASLASEISDSDLSFKLQDWVVRVLLEEAKVRVRRKDELTARRCLEQINEFMPGESDSLENVILPILRQLAQGRMKFDEFKLTMFDEYNAAADAYREAYRIFVLADEATQAAELQPSVLKAVEVVLAEEYQGLCFSGEGIEEEAKAVCSRLTELLDTGEYILQPNLTIRSTTLENALWIFAGSAGDVITIDLQGANEQFDPSLMLIGPERKVVSDDDSGGGYLGHDARIDGYALPVTGIYIVRTGQAGSSAPYTILLSKPEIESISLGETVTSTTEERSLWEFHGTAGDIITIDLQGATKEFDPYLTLIAPDGTEFSDDDSGGGYLGYDARIRGFVLPETGKYTIRTGRTGSSVPYTLSVELTDEDALALDEQIVAMLENGQVQQALTLLETSESETVEQIPLEVRAMLCLLGAIDGYEQAVLSLCEETVAETTSQFGSEEAVIAQLGYAVALALVGETEEALPLIAAVILAVGEDAEDLARLERWVSLLRQNQNPFDETELDWFRENL